MARLIIISNHEIWAAGLSALLGRAGHQVIATCARTSDLVCLAAVNDLDILIVCRESGPEPIRHDVCLEPFRKHPRLVLVVNGPVHAAELVAAKADGIVVSSPDPRSLIECVDSVARGIRWVDPDLLGLVARTRSHPSADAQLTWREREIVQCVVRGLRNKAIGRELRLSEGTVKMHLHHIFSKLKIHSRTELALLISQGLEPRSDGSSGPYDMDAPTTRIHARTSGAPDISRSLQVQPTMIDSIVFRQSPALRRP